MAATGEVGIEKATIPLHWVATILISVSGMVATAATSHYRLSVLEEEVKDSISGLQVSDKTAREHELKLQKLELSLESMKVTLEKIDSKLERMESRQFRDKK